MNLLQVLQALLMGLFLEVASSPNACSCEQKGNSCMVVPCGLPGSNGLPGRDGKEGSKGEKGDQGARGTLGPPGKLGPPGTKGDKGVSGLKGQKGDSGGNEINQLRAQMSALQAEMKSLQATINKIQKAVLFPTGRSANGKLFLTTGSEGNFETAKKTCSEAGGLVASPGSASENSALQQMVNLHGKSIFLGMNDQQTEGIFRFLNQKPVSYTNWSPNEPNSSGGEEDCIELYSNGKWNDKSCDNKMLIVCEI
ncbi:pulmonary surfactant-associated protein D-like [Tachyglossus aculeatus]|uniref:pulmonary surfactant-associated protein D-like n=1 Tax=Tachyglossus aculeatus TaxID=9261 RepID=UPI0018F65948|nr:pulmonary surfactant-associated protein D-like [Tachyglossus aculeatus]